MSKKNKLFRKAVAAFVSATTLFTTTPNSVQHVEAKTQEDGLEKSPRKIDIKPTPQKISKLIEENKIPFIKEPNIKWIDEVLAYFMTPEQMDYYINNNLDHPIAEDQTDNGKIEFIQNEISKIVSKYDKNSKISENDQSLLDMLYLIRAYINSGKKDFLKEGYYALYDKEIHEYDKEPEIGKKLLKDNPYTDHYGEEDKWAYLKNEKIIDDLIEFLKIRFLNEAYAIYGTNDIYINFDLTENVAFIITDKHGNNLNWPYGRTKTIFENILEVLEYCKNNYSKLKDNNNRFDIINLALGCIRFLVDVEPEIYEMANGYYDMAQNVFFQYTLNENENSANKNREYIK